MYYCNVGVGTIGSLDYTPEERQVLAKKSKNWECPTCGKIAVKLISAENARSPELTQEESSMIQNIALKVIRFYEENIYFDLDIFC